MVRNLSAVHNRAVNFGAIDLIDPKFNEAVINQNAAARLDILRKVRLADRDNRIVAEQFPRGQRELCILQKLFGAVLKIAEANLRSLRVK